jgi:hypothetical protein
MDPKTTTALIVSAFSIASLQAQHVLIQPSYGTSFKGQALRFECVAALKSGDERSLIATFRAKSAEGRRDRLGGNVYSACGIAALAENHLIDDPSALGALTECLEHPLL